MLNCFSSCMFAAHSVNTRYWSNRTDYGKIKDKIKNSPSGSSAASIHITAIQKWKLANWAFIEQYIKKRKNPKGAEMGKVSIRNNLQIMFTLIKILLHLSHIFSNDGKYDEM